VEAVNAVGASNLIMLLAQLWIASS